MEAVDGRSALALTARHAFDMILLDGSLPDMEGREACKAMRAAGVRAPIIMLNSGHAGTDNGGEFNAGVSDAIAKPFRMAALLARVQAHLRQRGQSDDAVFVIGPYDFDPAAKRLTRQGSGEKIRLTEKETAILKFLHHARGRTVTRETLLGEVWGYSSAVTTHTLETHIYRLRQKIENGAAPGQILVTEPGGYRLNVARYG
jgi:DNA-binding response OmpR family regulator